jgi:hypothetical protein
MAKVIRESERIHGLSLVSFSIADDRNKQGYFYPIDERSLSFLETIDTSGRGSEVQRYYNELANKHNEIENTRCLGMPFNQKPRVFQQVGENPFILGVRYETESDALLFITHFSFDEYVCMERPRKITVKRKQLDEYIPL